ncbi:MAG TPA: prepilin-type N-terminal cleavage/methylation domain-containing protein [Gemmatimonadales bacterium]|jgi:prepilin-type N-terminal cleavage/methylation domain-containing protein
MRGRRGFTLVEIMVVMVMMLLVGAALTRILVNSMRVSRAQMITADMQSNVRVGGLAVPLELREIGYDSNISELAGPGAVRSDIEAIGTNFIQFRASRGFSTLCGAWSLPNGGEGTLRIRKPVLGIREPLPSDSFQVFVENTPTISSDDQWLDAKITAIDLNGICGAGGDPAIILTVSAEGISTKFDGTDDVVDANLSYGSPVRWFERMRFGSFVDADGLTYLGARSISAGEGAYRAVAGPMDPITGFMLTYYNKNGVPVAPGVGNPVDVRTIEVQLLGRTGSQVALAGTRMANRTMITTTRVALRNTLRH